MAETRPTGLPTDREAERPRLFQRQSCDGRTERPEMEKAPGPSPQGQRAGTRAKTREAQPDVYPTYDECYNITKHNRMDELS
jgi:hypothetical protein